MTIDVRKKLAEFNTEVKSIKDEATARKWSQDFLEYFRQGRISTLLLERELALVRKAQSASNEIIRDYSAGLHPDFSSLRSGISELIAELERRSVGPDGYPLRR